MRHSAFLGALLVLGCNGGSTDEGTELDDSPVGTQDAGSEDAGEVMPGEDGGADLPDAGPGELGPSAPRIAATGTGTCAIGADANLVCWGGDQRGPWEAPAVDEVRSVSASVWAVCVANDAQEGHCFRAADGIDGLDNGLKPFPDPNVYAEVRSGEHAMLALREDGTFLGQEHGSGNFTLTPVIDEPLVDVAGAGSGFCGIRQSDASIVCWRQFSTGWDDPCDQRDPMHGTLEPPDGSFVQLDAGSFHFCAVATDGTVECWGAGDGATSDCAMPSVHRGQSTPPSGSFRHVSAGRYHSCGVRSDGTLACWGAGTTADACDDSEFACGMAAPPPGGGFVQVAAGVKHSCALKANGKVVCWGSDTYGRATPPEELR